MKGLILAAGGGTRLLPFTRTILKPLMPIAHTTLLEHNLDKLCTTGIEEVVIVIPEGAQEVFESMIKPRYPNIKIDFVEQKEKLGTAHAVGVAQPFIGDDSFFLTYGDNVSRYPYNQLIDAHKRNNAVVTMALREVADPTKHGVAEIEEDRIVRLVEKPEVPPSNLTFAGMCILEPVIFDAIAQTPKSPQGEYFLPDSIQILIDEGYKVSYDKLAHWRLNVNSHEQLLVANMEMLKATPQYPTDGLNYTINPPVYIGENAKIGEHSIIGPNVMLCRNCCVGRGVKLENTVVLENTHIDDGNVIANAIVGQEGQVQVGAK